MTLRLHRLALAEIDHEVDYYESQQPGLGERLEDEIAAALELIERFPQAAPRRPGRTECRVAVLDRFPFVLPYVVRGDQILILALAHMRRRPGYWLARR